MLRTRQQIETNEAIALAPYAQKSEDSAGRAFSEPPHPYRTDYQRDRARIIHSKAFRRLEYKTQVFLNGTGDHLRTRLTHTMEVASISRTIAGALGANADLTEVIALAHDLGHAPLGHAGEEVLDRLMAEHGGFEHNNQSIRLVEFLENKYPRFPGLNLSYEVIEGLHKHQRGLTRPATNRTPEATFPSPSLEAQIADLADEITYYSHDLDDGLDYHLITEEQLAELEIWKICAQFVRMHFPNLTGDMFQRYVIRTLIDYEVDQLVRHTDELLTRSGVKSADAVRSQTALLARYPEDLRRMNLELRKFLYKNLYFHPKVAQPNQRAAQIIEAVFQHYLDAPEIMGTVAYARIAEQGLYRTVCDYVSGMTDRFLIDEARRLGLA